jgi:RNA polymerase primary sigma factor
MERLSEREQEVLILRFGLNNGGEPMILEDVGHKFGLTRERVRQIESVALRKLRAWLNGQAYRQLPKKKPHKKKL